MQASGVSTRQKALNILGRIEKDGAFSTLLLGHVLASGAVDPIDSRLLSHLVYGVLKRLNTLDWVVDHHLRRKKHLRPVIRNILRLGTYQLLFMNSIPSYAACSTSVELVRTMSRNVSEAGFVNAVLRNITRRPELKLPDETDDEAGYVSLKHSHPRWLVKRWLKRWGPEAARRICQANNRTPAVTLRVNTSAISREAFIRKLEILDIKAREGNLAPDTVRIPRRSFSRLQPVAKKLYSVQDEASVLVGHLLRPVPGERILDLCAGLGTKTLHILDLVRGQAAVTALDIHRFKLEKLAGRIRECGFTEPQLVCRDALAGTLFKEIGLFDKVLVDAPCSGLGTVRHKPELKWRAYPEKLRDLSRLQTTLLKAAAMCLKPGGILLYATCSTEPDENGQVIDMLLESSRELEPAALPGLDDLSLDFVEMGDTRLSLSPHVHGTDGFFVAAVTRV